jgi:hypothetical protein
MQITELLISYYTQAIAEHKAASKQLAKKPRLSNIKKTKKTNESKITMQQPTPIPSRLPKPVTSNSTIVESKDVLEEPIFGIEDDDDRKWANCLKKYNPEAYQRLLNGD